MEAFLIPGQTDFIFHHNNTRPPTETSVFGLLSLKEKTAIISGAASGIGEAAAETFAEAGANVAIWYNSNPKAIKVAASIAEKYNVKCIAYRVNVANEKEIEETLIKSMNDLNGRLDIFVANAAIPWFNGTIIDSDSEVFRNLMDINFMGVYFAAKHVGEHFRRQKSEGTNLRKEKLENFNTGSFIITSSAAGFRQLAPQATTPYCVAKAALNHFTKCLAVEWIQFARVNSVNPAYIATEMLNGAPDFIREPWKGRTPMGREGVVSEVKGAYLYLASDASSYTTGTQLLVDGGYTCV
ncbi:Sorbose reductase sou1 [Orbilia ellipsospora]|uniref:Sorbose reductase sou1 n=1 Tax=Orbilia ellipsospora TaxID=2528407 RepID=A0AAV9X4Z9_9PEZI